MFKDQDIVDKLMGSRFVSGGRNVSTGLDCYGLIRYWYKRKYGINLYDLEEPYDMQWSKKGENYFLEKYHLEWDRVHAPMSGDVVMFQNEHGVCNHVGIVLEKGFFIHCSKVGVNIAKYTYKEWRERLEGFYRYKRMAGSNEN